jgi:hypothetical protein
MYLKRRIIDDYLNEYKWWKTVVVTLTVVKKSWNPYECAWEFLWDRNFPYLLTWELLLASSSVTVVESDEKRLFPLEFLYRKVFKNCSCLSQKSHSNLFLSHSQLLCQSTTSLSSSLSFPSSVLQTEIHFLFIFFLQFFKDSWILSWERLKTEGMCAKRQGILRQRKNWIRSRCHLSLVKDVMSSSRLVFLSKNVQSTQDKTRTCLFRKEKVFYCIWIQDKHYDDNLLLFWSS